MSTSIQMLPTVCSNITLPPLVVFIKPSFYVCETCCASCIVAHLVKNLEAVPLHMNFTFQDHHQILSSETQRIIRYTVADSAIKSSHILVIRKYIREFILERNNTVVRSVGNHLLGKGH